MEGGRSSALSPFTMPPIPIENTITLSCGSLFTGMTLVLTTQILWSFGIKFNLSHDRKRQTILNFICFLAAVNGLIAYPSNQTGQSVLLSNVTTLLTFTFVQYALVIVNHNSLTRANSISMKYQLSKTTLDYLCFILYMMPLLVLIPIILAANDAIPDNEMINQSHYNIDTYKPINIFLSIATEVFATVTDLLLFKNVFAMQADLVGSQGSTSSSKRERMKIISRDLMASYAITWCLLAIDIMLKIMIIFKFPVLFDSIVSIATLAMRARCNLLYGLNMVAAFELD